LSDCVCLQCSACAECPARTFPMAELR
jgi:hypothetical protein